MELRNTREIITTSVMSRPYAGGWIGYDWFKLVVAAILAALLLWFWFNPPLAAIPATPALPAASVSAVPPAATAAGAAPVAGTANTPALPVLTLPAEATSAGQTSFSGTGEPGATIQLLIDGQPSGETVAAADGTWSIDADLAQPGEYAVSVRTVGAGGAALNESAAVSLTVETPALATAPAPAILDSASAPAITTPADGAQLPAGPITIGGSGTPGAQVEVLDGDRVVGTAIVADDGNWTLQDTPAETTAVYGARPAGSTAAAATTVRVATGQVETCTALAVGCNAWVTREGGLELRLRAGPGTSAGIITRLPIGTQMSVLEGPQPANDLTWWRVRSTGGQEGWIAGEQVRLQPD